MNGHENLRKIDSRLGSPFPKEGVRNCGEQACAVSAAAVGVDTTTVFEPD